VIEHFCAKEKLQCSKGASCPWWVPYLKPETAAAEPTYKGPCKNAFKIGHCRCFVEHHNRTDKTTAKCPYDHWVLVEESENDANGQPKREWYKLSEAGLKVPMPSCKVTVAEVLNGNRAEAKYKARERDGQDHVVTGRQQIAIGREATHETYERQDLSAMEKLGNVERIQVVIEKGQELVDEGKIAVGDATRRRQGQWNKKK